MGKSKLKRAAVDRSTYARVSIPPPRTENQVVPITAMKKKMMGSWTWMRFDANGNSELLEFDKNALLQRVSIPARDLRILGPIFSPSSHILGKFLTIGSTWFAVQTSKLLIVAGLILVQDLGILLKVYVFEQQKKIDEQVNMEYQLSLQP